MYSLSRVSCSAELGIAHRDGLGCRCRHIKVQYLWIQSKIKEGDLKLQKVLGTSNVADDTTKAVDRWALDKYMAAMNFTLTLGGADKASHGLAFISTEEGVKIPPMRQLIGETPLSPVAMTRMR